MNKLIKKLLKKLPEKENKAVVKKQNIHPGRDWLIALLLFTIFTVVGGSISAHLFLKYNSLDLSASNQEVPVPSYNSNLTQEAIDKYRKKENLYEKTVPVASPVVSEDSQPEENQDSVFDVETELSNSTTSVVDEEVSVETEADTLIESEIETGVDMESEEEVGAEEGSVGDESVAGEDVAPELVF